MFYYTASSLSFRLKIRERVKYTCRARLGGHATRVFHPLSCFSPKLETTHSLFLSPQINQSLIPLLPATDAALYFPFESCKKAIRVA